jgi:hypothetical protein
VGRRGTPARSWVRKSPGLGICELKPTSSGNFEKTFRRSSANRSGEK